MTDFSKLNITSALIGLKNKDFKSVELTEYFINQINKKENLNCFITKTFDKAIDMAKKSDEKIIKKRELGSLEGIPIGMKDIFCLRCYLLRRCKWSDERE